MEVDTNWDLSLAKSSSMAVEGRHLFSLHKNEKEIYYNTLRQINQRLNGLNRKHRAKSKNHSRDNFQEVQNSIHSNQNIWDCSSKQCKLKKFNYLKYGPRQNQQYSPRDDETTREDETTEKRQISQAAAVRKVTVRLTYFEKKSNTNIRKSFENYQAMKIKKHHFHSE